MKKMMSCSEAARLEPGDLVISKREGRSVEVEVMSIRPFQDYENFPYRHWWLCPDCQKVFATRRRGRARDGSLYPVYPDDHQRFQAIGEFFDFDEANIFADYLEDNEFPEAARFLRTRFPLSGLLRQEEGD